MNSIFRKATISDVEAIWIILQQAILRRKTDGSQQWQDGYPNLEVIKKDIEKNAGYVLLEDQNIIGYVSIVFNDEPAYAELEGNWLSNSDFVVLHRIAIAENHLGKGLAQKIVSFAEELALQNNVFSIKVDTNFDNFAMLNIFKKMGYVYCGEVEFRGSKRKAFEKILK